MKSILILPFILLSCIAFSQNIKGNGNASISGKVTDSTAHTPLEYATISLFTPGNTNPVNGTTTDQAGNFKLEGVAAGTYRVVVEFIGYTPFTLNNVLVQSNGNVSLKDIKLARKGADLQAVVVTAQGKIIDNKIDKMVFNAERDLTSQTGVATDILKKVPQVSVDVDGNVELAGSSGIRFLINGKPSSAFGSNITDVLQSIPASQIKSIEVITNPGAKYDAQGMGGIINIILKNNTARGVNGSLSLTAGTRQNNGSFNFNARKGKLGVNAFISGNIRPYVSSPFSSDRTATDSSGKTSLLHQEGSSEFLRSGLQTGAGFDWSPTEHSSLTGSFSLNQFNNKGNSTIQQYQRSYVGSSLSDQNSTNITNNQFHFQNADASLNFKRTFAKEDQELNIQVNTSIGHNTNNNSNNQYYQPGDSLFFGNYSNNPGKETESEFQVDYTQPLQKKVLLGMGGKLNFRDLSSTSNVNSYQPVNKDFEPNKYLSYTLNYHQKVYALYSELSFPVGNWLEAKTGLRYERTEINSYFSNALHQAVIPGYNTFVPSIYFSHKIGENQTIKLSYSKRIERPEYRDLNPFINTSDPKNISQGNPYLQPEIGNRFELGYNNEIDKVGSFMVNLFYRTSNHDIQNYTVFYPSLVVGDTTYTNVSLNTRENIGKEQDYGLNIFGDLKLVSKLNIRTNIFLFQRYTINTFDPGVNSNSFNYRFNLNGSYQFTPTLAGEFFGNFNSPRRSVQGSNSSFTFYSFAIRKQFWNKKGSLALTAVNPFSKYLTQTSVLYGKNFNATSERKIPFRSFGINFTWKFGKLEFKKQKEESPVINAPEGT